MAPLAFTTVDAFTTKPFSGNPASVVVFAADDARGKDTPLLQRLGLEFNLSETAMLVPLEDSTEPKPRYSLRWFTPAVEIKLCGHATLASASVLFSSYHPEATHITFETLSGLLVAEKLANGQIALDFPDDTSVMDRLTEGPLFERAVAGAVASCPSLAGHVVASSVGTAGFTLIELSSEVELEKLEVDASAFITHATNPITALTQVAPSSSPYDIYSRCFAPAVGILEDPVTGSLHCSLAPFWLGTAASAGLGKDVRTTSFKARQVSARGGDIDVTWDREAGRIKLVGSAVKMMSGEVHI